jgi:penicillin-binding protein 2
MTSSRLFAGNLLEYRAQNRWFIILIVLVNVLILGRFFYVQVVGGKKYEKLAEINQVRRARIPPRRGEVFDRKGRLLATNIYLYKVSIIPHYIKDIDSTLRQVQNYINITAEDTETITSKYNEFIHHKNRRFHEIVVRQHLNGTSCPRDGTPLERTPPVQYLRCRTCGAEHIPLPTAQKECPFDSSPLRVDPALPDLARCPRCNRSFTYSQQCPADHTPMIEIQHDLRCSRCHLDTSDSVAALRAHLHELDGVYIREDTIRAYPHGPLFAHVVGYVNEVNQREIEVHPGVYRPKDMIGRTGIEKSMEEVLRGKAGEEVTFRDSRGRTLRLDQDTEVLANLKYEPAMHGNNVVLTLDLEIQRILQEELRGVASAGIVILDVDTGETLGLYSSPTFDPNDWAGRLTREKKKEYDDNPYYPMIDKATTAFPPASTFKIVTALAALNEGTVVPETTFNCPGYYNYSGRQFRCYNRYGHGDVDLRHSISTSCDVYFYRLGELLGMDRLEDYSVMMGLGSKTGIEIGEDMGLIPSRAYHERHSKGGFQPGFTLSSAVGQKDIKATPLQMAMVLAQVVNGGYRIRPFVVDRIEDQDGNTVRSTRRERGESLNVPMEHLQVLIDAMILAVEDDEGTAHTARKESLRFGAKTGTAEARQSKPGVDPVVAQWLMEDHAWMVAFAPVDHPRIAVACIVEHGGFGGSVAGPIVSNVIFRLISRNLVPVKEEEN